MKEDFIHGKHQIIEEDIQSVVNTLKSFISLRGTQSQNLKKILLKKFRQNILFV